MSKRQQLSVIFINYLKKENVMADKGFQIEEDLPKTLMYLPFCGLDNNILARNIFRPINLQQFGSMRSVQFYE